MVAPNRPRASDARERLCVPPAETRGPLSVKDVWRVPGPARESPASTLRLVADNILGAGRSSLPPCDRFAHRPDRGRGPLDAEGIQSLPPIAWTCWRLP